MRFLIAFFAILSCAAVPAVMTPPPLVETAVEKVSCPAYVELDEMIDDSTASRVAAQLAACKGVVVLEINSPGGSVVASWEIQKAIERHPAPVVCLVDGMAASAAFVTLQSCDLRLMTRRSILMAHQASAPSSGQRREHENTTETLRAIDRAQVLQCAHKMGMAPDNFEAHISGGKEWWFALDDALKFRAVDYEADGLMEALILANLASKPDGGQ